MKAKKKHNRTHEMRYSFCSQFYLLLFRSLTLHKRRTKREKKISISFMPRLMLQSSSICTHNEHTYIYVGRVTKHRASTVFLIQFISKKFCAVISCSPSFCSFCVFSILLVCLLLHKISLYYVCYANNNQAPSGWRRGGESRVEEEIKWKILFSHKMWRERVEI
jgi:hypothetical protein